MIDTRNICTHAEVVGTQFKDGDHYHRALECIDCGERLLDSKKKSTHFFGWNEGVMTNPGTISEPMLWWIAKNFNGVTA